MNARRRTPAVNAALAALAAMTDKRAGALGCWREPDGTLSSPCTREDWRVGLLDGSVDPDAFLRNARLMAAIDSGALS